MAVALNLCTVCDAPPGRCQHGAARYLEPIIYERAEGGWRVPKNEQARWAATPTRPRPPRGPLDAPEQTARPADQLVIELDAWLYLDKRLEGQFRDLHEHDPERATRLAARVVAGASTGSLHHPDAYLASELNRKT